jgi:hypothetical protein
MDDASKVILTCAICHKVISVVRNHCVFTPIKKEWPRNEQAEYNEQTIIASL